MSDGKPTTFEVVGPTSSPSPSPISSSTSEAATSALTSEPSSTGSDAPKNTAGGPPTVDFPACHDANAKPFCVPNNESTLYVGDTYYVTWNPDFFPSNTTVTIKLQFMNDTLKEAWSSKETENSWGMASVTIEKAFLQGYSSNNLTFYAINFDPNDPKKKAEPYKGPTVTVTNQPPKHYEPPEKTKSPNKMGLMIGLPVSLGFVALVVLGLWLGMRKHRHIGIGSVMGRRKGYGTRQSKRQRMGLGKKGAIRLEQQEPPIPDYRDDVPAPHAHARGGSLGSLVSDDGIRPAPGGNQFRDEVQRQRTGGRL
ncbi:hypothetical protein GQ43DRAFT_369922 [Delitschia confertaspora ATCC 74209]|uniref:Uncharacterized protein n=1 Tax=Delitschia confertaspora ATCC 74209 TaxID=1513339 RepID=A0A9P4JRT7_9PLEO|nr:hypothetical protein GQ43DRAFT_369922 [Delitschia confertaspora ATCC 74209]